MIKNRLRKRLPNFIAHRLARKLARRVFKVAPEFVVTFLPASESNDSDGGRQFSIGGDVI